MGLSVDVEGMIVVAVDDATGIVADIVWVGLTKSKCI